MISKSMSLTLVKYFIMLMLTLKENVEAMNNYDPNDFFGLEDLSNWEEVSNIQITSIVSPNGKRRRSSGESLTKKPKKRLKYCSTNPISHQVQERAMIEKLTSIETKLKARPTTDLKWKHFDEVDNDNAKRICDNAWAALSEKEVEVAEGMKHDCDYVKVPGPSKQGKNIKHYNGYYEYLDGRRTALNYFYPDLIRCNCAFIYTKTQSARRTVGHSSRFFFLCKASESVYYVLTTIGDRGSRDLRIVNVLPIQ